MDRKLKKLTFDFSRSVGVTVPMGTIGGNAGLGPWGNIPFGGKDVGPAANEFSATFSRLMGIMTIIAGLWFMFRLIQDAYSFMTAMGDEGTIKKTTESISKNVTGLIIVVAAYAILQLLGKLLGFDILNPQDLIKILKP